MSVFALLYGISILGTVFNDDCFVNDNGEPVYFGNISVTISGIPCQRWDVLVPHEPIYPMSSENENYCRSPDNDTLLWCYTTDPGVPWDYCNISECANLTTEANATSAIIPTTEIPTTGTLVKTSHLSSITPANLTKEANATSTIIPTTEILTTGTLVKTSHLSSSITPVYTASESSTTSPPVTTTSISSQLPTSCACPCEDRNLFWITFFNSNLTDAEKTAILNDEKKKLRDNLLVEKTTLTSYIRARTSVNDDRPTAKSIGAVGVVILCIVFGIIIASDCSSVVTKLHNKKSGA